MNNQFVISSLASKSVSLRVRAAKAWFRQIPLRISFRFGKAVMTELPVATLKLSLENASGCLFEGWAASGLPPMWFDKREGRTLDGNVADLLASIREACATALSTPMGSPWELHQAVDSGTRAKLAKSADPMPSLAAGFGPALFELAMVDGLCRHQGRTFFSLLQNDGLGMGDPTSYLPTSPTSHMHLRHTVGMADPLTDADLGPMDRLRDGLPQTLAEVISTYRPRYFKVKIGGGDEATVKRLITLAHLLDSTAGDYRLSLDGNEQWENMTGFFSLWQNLESENRLKSFLKRILYVEQPVRRECSTAADAAEAVKAVATQVPLLIDESDGEPGIAEAAFALGYSGVSVKACKGLFRALHHAKLVAARRKQGLPGFLSSEDLTTVPTLPVQQDLALAAALGLTHSERNGHHFARGGRHLTGREASEALRGLPTFYAPGLEGEPTLRIADGSIDLSDINAVGFGGSLIPDTFHQQIIFHLPA